MSETIQDTTPEPEAVSEAPEAAPEAPPEPDPKEAEARLNKRIAFLRAQASTAQRERDQFAARLAAVEAQARQAQPQQQPVDPQIQQAIQAEAHRISEHERTQERIQAFHAEGREAYPDWPQRMNDLQAMGADAEMANLLVSMTGGHKIAAALRDEPEELERIAALRGERARAIALGQYAAKLAATPTRQISRAPPPPKPVQGRVAPVFNEQQATTDQLVDFYAKQAMERRRH